MEKVMTAELQDAIMQQQKKYLDEMKRMKRDLEQKKIYRWCDDQGGGIVFASSAREAWVKVVAKCAADERGVDLQVWEWERDDFNDPKHPDVLDIYS